MALPRCYFDITIGGQPAGRIIMEVIMLLFSCQTGQRVWCRPAFWWGSFDGVTSFICACLKLKRKIMCILKSAPSVHLSVLSADAPLWSLMGGTKYIVSASLTFWICWSWIVESDDDAQCMCKSSACTCASHSDVTDLTVMLNFELRYF